MWHISAFVAHCLFMTLDQLGDDRRGDLFQIWRTTLTAATGLKVTPLESDYAFFRQLLSEELARLAARPTNADLPCGHAVHEHKNALTKWQEENLPT